MFPKEENPDQDPHSLSSWDCLEAAWCFPERWLEWLGTTEPSTGIKATSSWQPPRRRYWQSCSLPVPSPPFPHGLRKQSGSGLHKETLPIQLSRGQQRFWYDCINPYSRALLLAFCSPRTIDNTFLKLFPQIVTMNNSLGVRSNTPPTTLLHLSMPLPCYTRITLHSAKQPLAWHPAAGSGGTQNKPAKPGCAYHCWALTRSGNLLWCCGNEGSEREGLLKERFTHPSGALNLRQLPKKQALQKKAAQKKKANCSDKKIAHGKSLIEINRWDTKRLPEET